MSKLEVKKVIIFKHGVSYYILEGEQKGKGNFELEFKIDEMNDVLKSLFVIDTSDKGYISSISYDAALDTYQLLKTIMLDIPDNDSFTSIVKQIKGAQVILSVGSSQKIAGTIMGIEFMEKASNGDMIIEKLLTLLKDDGIIVKIPFTEITSFDIENEDLMKDLKFFLETVIAGKKKDSKKIIINCESGGVDDIERKIVVSYIQESPVWKTTYRVIMTKSQALEEKCLLSGWCMVENTTNQDWEEIELVLVAGMPVSFIYDFYRPIYIDRPKIQPPRVLSARPTEIEEEMSTEKYKDYDYEEDLFEEQPMEMLGEGMFKADMKPMAPPAPKRAAITGAMDETTIFEKQRAQTTVQTKDLGELFEYKISNPVTIKRKHSALVPILTEEIKARKILLYNKNEFDKNPNACLEITNNTPLTLERGPATIVYDDNLAGEAIIPFMNKEDTRLLNYAVEQAVIITHTEKSQNRNVHRVSVKEGYSYEYYHTDLSTKYKIKNKTNETKQLYLDHPKSYQYEIKHSPIEPEETPNYWRFKLTLKPKDAIVFKIRERRENYSSYWLQNYSKDDLLKTVALYAKLQFISGDLEGKLREVADLIGEKNELQDKKYKLDDDKNRMIDEQARIRENIRVLGKTSQESSLREKYVRKLDEQETMFEKIRVDIKELEAKILVLDKDIEEKIYALKFY